MAQYIDKVTVVAEIDRLQEATMDKNQNFLSSYHEGIFDGLSMIEKFLDTLEVKEVEEPNASDRGMAEEIIINLKRVEQDYRIDLAKEIEWLRNKVKKGE